MASKATCYVTDRIPSGPAFAVREDNDEKVFIGSTIAEILELEEMDEIVAVMVKNNGDKSETTPWRAIRAVLLELED